MDKKRHESISKALSFWLRHRPEKIGIKILENGWVNIDELVEKSQSKFYMTREEVEIVVLNQDPNKRRLSISEDLSQIRANQGHSIDVKIEFDEVIPPKTLYHGAPVGVVDLIMKEGIKKMSRHAVHLSPDYETAEIVGSRRGSFTVLEIDALKMSRDGYKIFRSENGVYLTEHVPSKYIRK